ncbi:acid phosphatase [Gracilaria domingensis]|nr:acid phosphatase [Gracilaria domingensis]
MAPRHSRARALRRAALAASAALAPRRRVAAWPRGRAARVATSNIRAPARRGGSRPAGGARRAAPGQSRARARDRRADDADAIEHGRWQGRARSAAAFCARDAPPRGARGGRRRRRRRRRAAAGGRRAVRRRAWGRGRPRRGGCEHAGAGRLGARGAARADGGGRRAGARRAARARALGGGGGALHRRQLLQARRRLRGRPAVQHVVRARVPPAAAARRAVVRLAGQPRPPGLHRRADALLAAVGALEHAVAVLQPAAVAVAHGHLPGHHAVRRRALRPHRAPGEPAVAGRAAALAGGHAARAAGALALCAGGAPQHVHHVHRRPPGHARAARRAGAAAAPVRRAHAGVHLGARALADAPAAARGRRRRGGPHRERRRQQAAPHRAAAARRGAALGELLRRAAAAARRRADTARGPHAVGPCGARLLHAALRRPLL